MVTLIQIVFSFAALLVLALLLAVPVTLVVAGVYSYKRRVFRYFLLLLGGALIALYAAFNIWETHSNLRALPPALDVKEMVYSKERSWTNEFAETRGAFRVFVLPDPVASALAEKAWASSRLRKPAPSMAGAQHRWFGTIPGMLTPPTGIPSPATTACWAFSAIMGCRSVYGLTIRRWTRQMPSHSVPVAITPTMHAAR